MYYHLYKIYQVYIYLPMISGVLLTLDDVIIPLASFSFRLQGRAVGVSGFVPERYKFDAHSVIYIPAA